MRLLLLASVLLALAGCGGGEGGGTTAAGAPIPGGGLSVSEARASTLAGPLMVAGYLVERGGELRLCEDAACEGASLRVEGDPGAEPGTGERISVLGEVEGGAITVSETAQG